MPSIILSDNGVGSGSAGIKTTGASDGTLALQTTTSGGTATTAVTIDTSQNVGVGTASPSYKTDVSGTFGANSVYITGSSSAYPTTGTVPVLSRADTFSGYTNGALLLQSRPTANAEIAFITGSTPSEKARIDSSGNFVLNNGNTTSYAKLTVNSGDGDQLVLNNAGTQYTSMYFRNNGTNKVSVFWDNTNARYYITPPTGGVYLANGGTSWTASSDERVKDVIEPIENATSKLANWRAVIGKYKTDEEGVRRSFLMAQDVLVTFPEAVDTTNEEEYGLRYQDTIPLLVKAIQEQQALIQTLTERISALEAK